MEVQKIAEIARLSVRKIRYVLDQRVLPGLRGKLQKHLRGRPRDFLESEGFVIACAGLLLEGGVRRKTVADLLSRLTDIPWSACASGAKQLTPRQQVISRPKTALEALYSGTHGPTELQIGDGVNLCLRSGDEVTGWFEPRTLAPLNDAYRPRVTIRLDLRQLREAFPFTTDR